MAMIMSEVVRNAGCGLTMKAGWPPTDDGLVVVDGSSEAKESAGCSSDMIVWWGFITL